MKIARQLLLLIALATAIGGLCIVGVLPSYYVEYSLSIFPFGILMAFLSPWIGAEMVFQFPAKAWAIAFVLSVAGATIGHSTGIPILGIVPLLLVYERCFAAVQGADRSKAGLQKQSRNVADVV